jgi:hypothetical protein
MFVRYLVINSKIVSHYENCVYIHAKDISLHVIVVVMFNVSVLFSFQNYGWITYIREQGIDIEDPFI